ncbi:MAG: chorismate mutase [Spirochaetes bacterium]|nr:chorismate mutase [Spirochaetota bacterium]
MVRGIRGATTIESNTREDILERTMEMLEEIIVRNDIKREDIASAIFSVTEGLDAEFPAVAARKLGWIYTPLFCTKEMPVKGSLGNCIRVLLHVNSDKAQKDFTHIYLHKAKSLRPDLASEEKDKYYSSDAKKKN